MADKAINGAGNFTPFKRGGSHQVLSQHTLIRSALRAKKQAMFWNDKPGWLYLGFVQSSNKFLFEGGKCINFFMKA